MVLPGSSRYMSASQQTKLKKKDCSLLEDSHSSHLTEEVLVYCHKHEISLGTYPLHNTTRCSGSMW
ncbi:hypothetical protein CC77DRAFT_382969 [Alternaria alternata]|uniref:Uncharacterized protein n=1 Tax=Alternaria alternata TaxID=5599 RepID=A0A177DCK3_ALTAL|nr:hypothetical protein CC77DRAFT_382969 [Alternaria alternata]OAG16579.1 hypothetical protein CC77DRAFT_382969 [Alternaria alternata]